MNKSEAIKLISEKNMQFEMFYSRYTYMYIDKFFAEDLKDYIEIYEDMIRLIDDLFPPHEASKFKSMVPPFPTDFMAKDKILHHLSQCTRFILSLQENINENWPEDTVICPRCLASIYSRARYCSNCGFLLLDDRDSSLNSAISIFFDIMSVSASISTIVQVILMVISMRSKKTKEKKANQVKGDNQGDIKSRVQMSNGAWTELESLEEVKSFIEIFQQPSSSPKPVLVEFHSNNRRIGEVFVSDTQLSKQQLDQFIELLVKRSSN